MKCASRLRHGDCSNLTVNSYQLIVITGQSKVLVQPLGFIAILQALDIQSFSKPNHLKS